MDGCNICVRPEHVHGHITGDLHNGKCRKSKKEITAIWNGMEQPMIKSSERLDLPKEKLARMPF